MGAGSDQANPIDDPQRWDYIKVAGNFSPGWCQLSGFKRPFGWDVKKGKGAKGSTVTLNEYPPAEGTVTFWFWEPDHFEAWREFRDIWNYDPTKKPISAVDIYHPSLADLDITKVVCKSISGLEFVACGYYKASIDLIEYNPPPKKPAVGTPNRSAGGVKKPPFADDDDPITKAKQAQISGLLAQAQSPSPTPGAADTG